MLSVILGCVIVVLIVIASSERAEAIAELNEQHGYDSSNNSKKG
ncbi:hypothetical protein PaecuDRAFT_2835 [Paenibacillus curdlanolyticus YK9]|uniref:Uncharacterized protein n=1 Tax=Paenibacillus curdlanolyticus YK9 TaxID=717606 RepID=E0IAJ5_9BACL|nr:hypothetical protein [Paenibacillus curdlanolyticus]EFM10399.1 hypothetical protein PaecuDRAFT_2835 [Paenibacillus curdlanolyticus YK9]